MENPWSYRKKGIIRIVVGGFLIVCYLCLVIYCASCLTSDIATIYCIGLLFEMAAPSILLLVFGVRAVRKATAEIRETEGNDAPTVRQMKKEFKSGMGAVEAVQRIKHGATVKLSIAQITNLLVNLPDAKHNLSEKDFNLLFSMYQRMIKEVKKIPMNYEKYVEKSMIVINAFDTIAPYEKYSGSTEHEVSVLMEGVYGKNHKRIRELHRELFWQEQALREIEEKLKTYTKKYKDALTDAEVKSMVQQKRMTQNDADEYLLLKKKIKAYIEVAPKLMRTTLDNISAIKEWIAELED